MENPAQETRKKSSKQSSRTPAPVCLQCLRGVRCNEKRFFCVLCKYLTLARCTGITNINYIKPTRAEEWTCPKCLISVLPFYGQNTLHASVSPRNEVDTTLAEDLHLEALKQNSKQLTVMHINTQSMIFTFDNLLLAVDRYKFDVITMSETWLKENHLLLQYVTIPGYTHAFNNRDKKRGGGVGVYIKDSTKFKRRSDIEKRYLTLEHLWLEIPGCNKHSRLLLGTIYLSESMVPYSDWIVTFESLLSDLAIHWDGALVLTGDLNVDLQRPDIPATKKYSGILKYPRVCSS